MDKKTVIALMLAFSIGLITGAAIECYIIKEGKQTVLEDKLRQLDYLQALYDTRDLINRKELIKQLDSIISAKEKEVLTNNK